MKKRHSNAEVVVYISCAVLLYASQEYIGLKGKRDIYEEGAQAHFLPDNLISHPGGYFRRRRLLPRQRFSFLCARFLLWCRPLCVTSFSPPTRPIRLFDRVRVASRSKERERPSSYSYPLESEASIRNGATASMTRNVRERNWLFLLALLFFYYAIHRKKWPPTVFSRAVRVRPICLTACLQLTESMKSSSFNVWLSSLILPPAPGPRPMLVPPLATYRP